MEQYPLIPSRLSDPSDAIDSSADVLETRCRETGVSPEVLALFDEAQCLVEGVYDRTPPTPTLDDIENGSITPYGDRRTKVILHRAPPNSYPKKPEEDEASA